MGTILDLSKQRPTVRFGRNGGAVSMRSIIGAGPLGPPGPGADVTSAEITAAKTGAETARDAAQSARDAALAVGNTNDTIMAGRTNVDGSAFRVALTRNGKKPVGRGEQRADPRDYGAVGNGSTDDSTALQAWLDALASEGVEGFLPALTFLHSADLTATQGVDILGNRKKTILAYTGTGFAFTVQGTSTADAISGGSLRKMTIQTRTTGGSAVRRLDARAHLIDSVAFMGQGSSGSVKKGVYGIADISLTPGVGTSGNETRNCRMSQFSGAGYYADQSVGAFVTRSRIYGLALQSCAAGIWLNNHSSTYTGKGIAPSSCDVALKLTNDASFNDFELISEASTTYSISCDATSVSNFVRGSVERAIIDDPNNNVSIIDKLGWIMKKPLQLVGGAPFTPASKIDSTNGAWSVNVNNDGNVRVHTMTGNGALTSITNGAAGQDLTIVVVQDTTGGRTVTSWPNNVKWAAAGVPTLSTTAGKADIFRFIFDGTNWREVARSIGTAA